MLLGALADICPVGDSDIKIKSVLRSSLDCKLALLPDSAAADCLVKSAIKDIQADYIICSSVPLCDGTDGNVISALEKGGIDVVPSEDICVTLEDAHLLAGIAAECGPKPAMDIIAVGYGADKEDNGRFLCVTLGEYSADGMLLENKCEYGEYV